MGSLEDRQYQALIAATAPFDPKRLTNSLQNKESKWRFEKIIGSLNNIAEIRTFPTGWALRFPLLMGFYNRYENRRVICIRGIMLTGVLTPSDQIDTLIHEALHMYGEKEFLGRHDRSPADGDNPISHAEHCVVYAGAREIAHYLGLEKMVKTNQNYRDGYLKRLLRFVPETQHKALISAICDLSANATRQLAGEPIRRAASINSLLKTHGVAIQS